MSRRVKFKRNDPCPCLSGKKYKHCCDGSVDWNEANRKGINPTNFLSVRGRNLVFAEAIGDALGFRDLRNPPSLTEYKAAFTAKAVRRIHEAVFDVWPKDLDIIGALSRGREDVSGLYVGDYDLQYMMQGLVRHSTYANKILVVDPFVYPLSVRNQYNPIENPEQYRAQTLKNVNFFFALYPWIDAGIVEIIRTPADFNPKLNWDSMQRQKAKFESDPELRKFQEATVSTLHARHTRNHALSLLLLSTPDSYLRELFRKSGSGSEEITEDEFIAYIQHQRDSDENFLAPLGSDALGSQLHMIHSGANYEIARITAAITGSYLMTDLPSRWKEIELDRQNHSAENQAWAPFAKAIQHAPLKYFNAIGLEHALRLRTEGRLESLRSFMHKVWRTACSAAPFSEENSQTLALELEDKIREAEAEWDQITQNLVKVVGAGLGTGTLAAGPLIADGHSQFLAAASAVGFGATWLWSEMQMRGFPNKFPAAFFMDLKEAA